MNLRHILIGTLAETKPLTDGTSLIVQLLQVLASDLGTDKQKEIAVLVETVSEELATVGGWR